MPQAYAQIIYYNFVLVKKAPIFRALASLEGLEKESGLLKAFLAYPDKFETLY